MFCTVLHSLKSPTNVGMIIRSHVAFGGREVVFVGYHQPWKFGKSTQAFSRKFERTCDTVFLGDDEELFSWTERHGYATVALEIDEAAVPLPGFKFPARTALLVGNEASGLSRGLLTRCDHRVVIPQLGRVESLNVAVSCSIAFYEITRVANDATAIKGSKFATTDAQPL
jgi:tRNA G18 (ribose-2'-O)-methylase SpoU